MDGGFIQGDAISSSECFVHAMMTNGGGYGIQTTPMLGDGEKCGGDDSCSEMETDDPEVGSQKFRAITWSLRSN